MLGVKGAECPNEEGLAVSEGEAEHGDWLHYLIYILFGRRKGQQKKGFARGGIGRIQKEAFVVLEPWIKACGGQARWEAGTGHLEHLEGTWFEDTVGCQQVLVQRLERDVNLRHEG